MFIDHPFQLDAGGSLVTTDEGDHLRDMIEQLLLTSPGERVNRADFGCGLLRQIFEPNSAELAAAVTFAIQAALARHLGDLIETQDVRVEVADSVLAVTLTYLVRRTNEQKRERFAWDMP